MRIDRPRGHPSRPLCFDDIAAKFRANARYAARPFEPWRVERIIDRVCHLEDVDDMQSLALLIADRGKPM